MIAGNFRLSLLVYEVMAMQLGGSGARRAEINVTPMIDVLLVLLIIFMVVLPHGSTGLNAKIPQPSSAAADENMRTDIVIHVGADGLIEVNSQKVALADLAAKLRPAIRPGAPVFIEGAKGISYREVAEVIDVARGAGATEFALMPAR